MGFLVMALELGTEKSCRMVGNRMGIRGDPMTTGAIQRENRPEHPIKKWAMKWVWRIQQIGAISTLLITAMTLAIVVSDKLYLSKVLPSGIGPLLALLLLGSLVMSLGYLWDKKFQMWKEQNVVNVERNPYYVFKMNPKEVVGYTDLWFPKIRSLKAIAESQSVVARHLGLEDEAKKTDIAAEDLGQVLREFEAWCVEQMRDDSVLAGQTKLLQDYLRQKAKNGVEDREMVEATAGSKIKGA